MGIRSGLVVMEGGYIAAALVMLMSPIFFPVLAIIAPVAPFHVYFLCNSTTTACPHTTPGDSYKYLVVTLWSRTVTESVVVLHTVSESALLCIWN